MIEQGMYPLLQRPFLVFVFLCHSVWNLQAQASEHFIHLEDQHLEMASFPGFVEKVIDATPDKPYIGYAQVGLANRRQPVRFDGGLDSGILRLFQRKFPDKGGNQPRFLVRINHLLVYERSSASTEFAYAEANISFWVKETGGYREVYETSAAINITNWSAKAIIFTCLHQH